MFDSKRLVDPGSLSDSGGLLFDRIDALSFMPSNVPRMRVDTALLGDIRLARVRSTGHRITLLEEANTSFLLPVSGRIEVATSRSTVQATIGGALFFSPNHRTTRVQPTTPKPYEAVVVLAPLDTLVPPDEASAPRGRGQFALTLHGSDRPDGALSRYLRYLVDEFDTPDTPLARPVAREAIEAQLVDLLTELALRTVDADSRRSAAMDAAKVRFAEALMWSRYGDPLTIAELARILEVTPRAVQLAFKSARGMSPRAVLHSIRMTRAQEKLRGAEPGTTVTDVALDCGFTHFGRFAAAYRQRFGEPPSETLKAALVRV